MCWGVTLRENIHTLRPISRTASEKNQWIIQSYLTHNFEIVVSVNTEIRANKIYQQFCNNIFELFIEWLNITFAS